MSEPALAFYTVVLRVRLDMDSSREHRQSMLDEYMVPEYRELPEFHLDVDERWRGTGLCVIEFDSEKHARDAVPALTRHGGPEFIEWGVYSVEFEPSASSSESPVNDPQSSPRQPKSGAGSPLPLRTRHSVAGSATSANRTGASME